MTTTRLSLREMLAELDTFAGRIPLHELSARLEALDLSFDDVGAFAHFGRESYQRNLMHTGQGYQALILCWRSGQRSPIHDHHGSSCGVKVLKGVATETYFDRTDDGYVYATSTRHLPEGGVCASQDADIHQISNLQGRGQDLVTLHIYSPALLHMGVYSLTDASVRDFFDPIHALMDGAGI